ncbi:Uncharacterized protein Rs2_45690 [Raphanus sativus]|nr:Uncharacterized protein Rs2_45690 [Raphanus sativus]
MIVGSTCCLVYFVRMGLEFGLKHRLFWTEIIEALKTSSIRLPIIGKLWLVVEVLQAHLEARAYRVKTIPIYPNLCFIFGKEVSDERYTRLAQAFDPTPAETLRINESEAKMDSRILSRWCKPAKRKMITSVAVVVLLV